MDPATRTPKTTVDPTANFGRFSTLHGNKTRMKFWISFLACIFLALPAGAAPHSLHKKIRIIALFDATDNKLSASAQADKSNFHKWYKSVFENESLEGLKGIAELQEFGDENSPLNLGEVLAYLSKYPIDSASESLLIYFSGHGGFDGDILGGFYLNIGGSKIGETELMDKMDTGWTILINDSCSDFSKREETRRQITNQIPNYQPPAVSMPDFSHSQPGPLSEGALKRFLLGQRGEFILRAASPNQKAWSESTGSFFSAPLFSILTPGTIDSFYSTKTDSFNFAELIKTVEQSTRATFQNAKKKEDYAVKFLGKPPTELSSANDQKPSTYLYLRELGKSSLGPVIHGGQSTKNGQRGFLFRSPYRIQGLKGQTVTASVFFYYPPKHPLENRLVSYPFANGVLSPVKSTIKFSIPADPNSTSYSGKLQIRMGPEQYDLRGFPTAFNAKIAIFSEDNELMAESPLLYMKTVRLQASRTRLPSTSALP